MGPYRQADLTTGGNEDYLGVSACGISKHVSAVRQTRGCRVPAAIERWHGLARQYQNGRLVGELHDVAIGFYDLIGVRRTQRNQSGDRAQGGEVLYWLVGRTIFSYSDGIMGEDIDHRDFH